MFVSGVDCDQNCRRGAWADRPERLDWVLNAFRIAHLNEPDEKQVDLFEACELLALDRYAAAQTYATALALSASQALGREVQFAAPGSGQLTFDEAWLLRLLDRSLVHDDESVAFLVSSRVAYCCRNSVAFLINGLAARLDEPCAEGDAPF
ncbi:MAG: hypothetical protein ACPGNV_15790 [Mangrovicoccus sp.]